MEFILNGIYFSSLINALLGRIDEKLNSVNTDARP